MRRSRDELTKDIDRMVELRNENKTFREIALIMGYKSPGAVSDLLRSRGHFSFVFNTPEIEYLVGLLKKRPASKIASSIIGKLTK